MAAAKNIVKVLSAAVRLNMLDGDGNQTFRQIGWGENGKPITEPQTKLVFLSRGDKLPDTVAAGEQKRLEEADALGTKEEVARFGDGRQAPTPEPAPVEEAAPSFDASTASDDELTNYIVEQKPNVSATVALAGSDPELAQRVLAAEKAATDGDARTSVVEKLEKLANLENA